MTQSSSSSGSSRTLGRTARRASGSHHKGTGPELYDFRRPTKLSREHVRTLQIAFETFARQEATLLTSSLRAVSQVTLVSIEQLTYDEYASSLASPTIMALWAPDPLQGTAILELSMGVAMACIDHMLGGPGGPQRQRPLTDIETPLLNGLIERALGELRYALESIVQIRPQLRNIEYNPQFAQAAAPSDPVIVASFEMRVGSEECVATVMLPFGGIVSKLHGERGDTVLTESQRQAREVAYSRVVAGLEAAPMDVAVRFQPVRMRPRDLVDLRPGDVVPLNHRTDTPLAVTAADMIFAHAVAGSHGNRLACLIVPPPAPPSASLTPQATEETRR